jgi:hypothetical protein
MHGRHILSVDREKMRYLSLNCNELLKDEDIEAMFKINPNLKINAADCPLVLGD